MSKPKPKTHIHIYRAAGQPATRYRVHIGDGKFITCKTQGRSPVWCSCCKQLRWAKHCTVQVYYDQHLFWCRDGCGCKKGRRRP